MSLSESVNICAEHTLERPLGGHQLVLKLAHELAHARLVPLPARLLHCETSCSLRDFNAEATDER
jgi:hypothetical protein